MVTSPFEPCTEPPTDHGSVIELVPTRGLGGSASTPLFEALIDGTPYVAWDTGDGRMACAPASCPHRPGLGPILQTRGLIEGGNLVCTRHANVYSGSSGECVAAVGPGDPGELLIRGATRVRGGMVLDPEPSGEDRAAPR